MCAHLSAPHAPVYLAAVNTAVKGNAKQAADMWRSREGQQYFVARGCSHVSEDLSRSLLGLILKKVTDASDAVLDHLQSLSGWGVQAFRPPAPAGLLRRNVQQTSTSAPLSPRV